MYDKTSLADDLQSQVRADKRKKQAVFDAIHIWEEFEGLSDEEIIKCLVRMGYIETEKEAWLWLRRFKEQKMLDSEKNYLKEQARLSGEIEEIRKTLARMENRK